MVMKGHKAERVGESLKAKTERACQSTNGINHLLLNGPKLTSFAISYPLCKEEKKSASEWGLFPKSIYPMCEFWL